MGSLNVPILLTVLGVRIDGLRPKLLEKLGHFATCLLSGLIEYDESCAVSMWFDPFVVELLHRRGEVGFGLEGVNVFT